MGKFYEFGSWEELRSLSGGGFYGIVEIGVLRFPRIFK
jgi:hypothetical protein